MKQPSLFFFSPGLFEKIKQDYGVLDDAKQLKPEQEVQHLKNVITGLKGYNTQLKKRL